MEHDIKLDVRGLEPSEPMKHALEALSHLNKNQLPCTLIDREPRPVYRIFDNNGFMGFMHSTHARPNYLCGILSQHKV